VFQLYRNIKTAKLKLMHLKVAILADILLCYFHWFCGLLLNLMALVIVLQFPPNCSGVNPNFFAKPPANEIAAGTC
jgi:hypothetical protein